MPPLMMSAVLLFLATGCSDSGSNGTGSKFGFPPAGGGPATQRMLDGSCLRNEEAVPTYAWGFINDEFWIERKEAVALPAELVKSLLGKTEPTSWIRGKWALKGDGFMLELTDISGSGGSNASAASIPVAVTDLMKISIGSAPHTVEENAARKKVPSFLSGLPVTFKDQATGQWGFKNAVSGDVIVPAVYERAWNYSEGGIACVWDGEPGIVNADGEHLLRPYWVENRPDSFVESRARYFDEEERMGFFDPKGTICIPAEWGYVESFKDGIAMVANDGTWKGEGQARRYSGGVWGAIDLSGQIVIEVRYHFLERGTANTFRDSPDGAWFRPGGMAALARE